MSESTKLTGDIADEKTTSLVFDVIHEVRRFNHVIKASSEILSQGSRGRIDAENIRHHAAVIFDNAYLVSLWLDMVELELNPEAFAAEPAEPRSLYGKFYKAAISFRRMAKHKHVGIKLTGDSKALLDCHPVIDILPYVLFENAVKYSARYGAVDVRFDEDAREVDITVSSMGPLLDEAEKIRLGQKYFRGHQAKEKNYPGSGRGLFLAKVICDLHGADLQIEAGPHRATFDGVPFGEFVVKMRFQR